MGYFSKFEWQNTIQSDISGFNAIFAFMFRQPKYKVGLTVRTPTSYEISNTYTYAGNSYFAGGKSASPISYNETSDYKLITPWIISAGISGRPIDWLLLACDAEYTDWTTMEFDSNDPDLIQENRNIKNWMRETWNIQKISKNLYQQKHFHMP